MHLNSSFFKSTLTEKYTVKQGQFTVELHVKYAGSPRVAKHVEKCVNDSLGHYATVQRLVANAEAEQSNELSTQALLESLTYSATLNDHIVQHLVNGYFDDSGELVLLDEQGVCEIMEYLTAESVKGIVEFCSKPENFGLEPLVASNDGSGE